MRVKNLKNTCHEHFRNTNPMYCKSIIKITIIYIYIWVHLSLNFGEVVPSGTNLGWVCKKHLQNGPIYVQFKQNKLMQNIN